MASVGKMEGSRRNAAQSTASFIEMYDRYEPRMRQIVDELQKVHREVMKWKLIFFAGGAGIGAAALLALLIAPVTGGLSLIIVLFPAFFFCFFILKQRMAEEESVGKVGRLVEEFRTMVFSVNSELEDVKSACGDLRRKSVGAEALKFIRLEIEILKSWSLSEQLQTPTTLDRIGSLSRNYGHTLSGFLQIKTKLQQLEENTDAGEGPAAPPTGKGDYLQSIINGLFFPPRPKRT